MSACSFAPVLVQISSSAVAAAIEYWPEQFKDLDQATHEQIRQNLRQVRPVLVNGVEALIMVCEPDGATCASCDICSTFSCCCTSSCSWCHCISIHIFQLCLKARMVLEDPGCVDDIIQDWQNVLPATLKKWNVQQQDLQVFFEEFRNNLLQNKEVRKAVTDDM